jgi:hypothetical protein
LSSPNEKASARLAMMNPLYIVGSKHPLVELNYITTPVQDFVNTLDSKYSE